MRKSQAALLTIFCAVVCIVPMAARAQGFFNNFNLFGPPPQYRPQEFEPARPPPRRIRPHLHLHPSTGLPKPKLATTEPGKPPAQPPEEPPPPYEPQLLRLSELMGALTYLQDLCGQHGQKGEIWRDKMTALMDAETKDPTRRSRLAGAYNRGFNGYQLSYRECTANAQAIITRFLEESGRLARDVRNHYGTS